MSPADKQTIRNGLTRLKLTVEVAQDCLQEDQFDNLAEELKQLTEDLNLVRSQLYLYTHSHEESQDE